MSGIGVVLRDPPSRLAKWHWTSMTIRAKTSDYRVEIVHDLHGHVGALYYDPKAPMPRFSGWCVDLKYVWRTIAIDVRRHAGRSR